MPRWVLVVLHDQERCVQSLSHMIVESLCRFVLEQQVFTPHECDDIITKLAATGRMRASTIGAGNLYGSSVSSNNRRTSSSVLINDEMMAEFPAIKAYAETLQQRAFELLQGETLGSWGRPGHAMLHRQWAFEGMQAAVYKKGQV